MIRISPIRVIGPDNEQVGVIETSEALRMADEAGLDLVEISPDTRPPVCKIMDYGKFKFEQSKKQQKSRQSSKAAEMKEIRLGRSVKIDPHDVKIRIDQARRFLMSGHKVLVTQRFRGREITHKELGLEHLREVADSLADIAKVEMAPRWTGRQASIILAPDRPKVEAVKRREEKAKAEAEKSKGGAKPADEKSQKAPEAGEDAHSPRPEEGEGSDASVETPSEQTVS